MELSEQQIVAVLGIKRKAANPSAMEGILN